MAIEYSEEKDLLKRGFIPLGRYSIQSQEGVNIQVKDYFKLCLLYITKNSKKRIGTLATICDGIISFQENHTLGPYEEIQLKNSRLINKK